MCIEILSSIKKRPVNLYIFIICFVLYLSNDRIFKNSSSFYLCYFFNCYFNDLLAPLLFFSYSNILLITRNMEWKRFPVIMLICLLCGIVWEYVAPFFKYDAVSDPWDMLCYVLGGCVYWYIRKNNPY